MAASAPVDDPVVIAQAQGAHGLDDHLVLALVIGDHHGGLGDLAHGQDGGLRGIDNGHEVIQVEHAQGGHSEGAAVIVGLGQPALPGLLDELRGLGGDAGEADDVGVPDHRHDQPAGDGDGSTDIYIIMVDDVAAVHAGVDDGEVLSALAQARTMMSL